MACVVVAVASLALPAAISFDPWAWLVWGREVLAFELDTTGGPSWKPLPVVATTVLSLFGDLAPALWQVLARTAGLLLVVGTFRLASRFAGPVAGGTAAALLVLTPDGDPRFLRTILEAHGAPLAAALAVWAVLCHLGGRRSLAFLLGAALSLERPEAWPFLAAYGAWLWWRHPERRGLVVAVALAVPALWFGGDWWGSGDPWHGAEWAQVGSGSELERLGESLGTVAALVVVPAWAAAAVALGAAWRGRDRMLLALGGGVVGWCALVVAMAVAFRYAALSRFLLPAAAFACVLAGVGVVRVVAALPRGRAGAAVAGALVVASAAFVVPRVAGISDVVEEVRARARLQDDLPAVVERAGGADAVLACGPVAVDGSTLLAPAVAWELDVPLDRIVPAPAAEPSVALVIAGGREDRALTARTSGVRTLARSDVWAVHAVDC